MVRNELRVLMGLLVLVALASACGEDESEMGGVDETTYVAFSEDHYQSQIQRLAAYQTISASRREAASASPAEANAIYVETIQPALETAELMEKVKGRTDDHAFASGANDIGTRLEADIVHAVELGSTTGDAQRVAYAGQIVDKTLLVFFYYSVYHELSERTKKNFDEAFGYYGLPNSGDAEQARGLAATAVSREENFSVSLNQPIFGLLLKGKGIIASELGNDASNPTETISGNAEYDELIEDVDRQMLLIFALGVKHEMEEVGVDEPDIKVIEANRFWLPLRAWSESNVEGMDFGFVDAQLLGALEGDALIEGLEVVRADPSVLDADAVIAEIDKVIAALQ